MCRARARRYLIAKYGGNKSIMMGKYLTGLLLITALTLAACGGSPAPAEPTAPDDVAPVAESPTDVPADDESAPDESAAPAEEVAPAGDNVFTLVAAESEARFYVNEVLLGQDNRVIGTAANAVEGQLTLDYADPAAVQMGTLTVDATTFVTDNTNRTRTLHRTLLETSTFPTVTFTATGFAGLPDTVVVGTVYDFQIMGDLTIHGVTQQVTFDATVTVVSDTRLEGIASHSTTYGEYGIQILRLPPDVASVESGVRLEIEFVAEKG